MAMRIQSKGTLDFFPEESQKKSTVAVYLLTVINNDCFLKLSFRVVVMYLNKYTL